MTSLSELHRAVAKQVIEELNTNLRGRLALIANKHAARTTMIAEIIKAILEHSPEAKCLVAAESHPSTEQVRKSIEHALGTKPGVVSENEWQLQDAYKHGVLTLDTVEANMDKIRAAGFTLTIVFTTRTVRATDNRRAIGALSGLTPETFLLCIFPSELALPFFSQMLHRTVNVQELTA